MQVRLEEIEPGDPLLVVHDPWESDAVREWIHALGVCAHDKPERVGLSMRHLPLILSTWRLSAYRTGGANVWSIIARTLAEVYGVKVQGDDLRLWPRHRDASWLVVLDSEFLDATELDEILTWLMNESGVRSSTRWIIVKSQRARSLAEQRPALRVETFEPPDALYANESWPEEDSAVRVRLHQKLLACGGDPARDLDILAVIADEVVWTDGSLPRRAVVGERLAREIDLERTEVEDSLERLSACGAVSIRYLANPFQQHLAPDDPRLAIPDGSLAFLLAAQYLADNPDRLRLRLAEVPLPSKARVVALAVRMLQRNSDALASQLMAPLFAAEARTTARFRLELLAAGVILPAERASSEVSEFLARPAWSASDLSLAGRLARREPRIRDQLLTLTEPKSGKDVGFPRMLNAMRALSRGGLREEARAVARQAAADAGLPSFVRVEAALLAADLGDDSASDIVLSLACSNKADLETRGRAARALKSRRDRQGARQAFWALLREAGPGTGRHNALDLLVQMGAHRADRPAIEQFLRQVALSQGVEPAADQRLALVYRDSLAAVYKEELELRVGQADVDRTLGTWPLLVRLIGREIGWAAELAERSWPAGHQAQLKIVRQLMPELINVRWLMKKLADLIPAISPRESKEALAFLESDSIPEIPARPGFLAELIALHRIGGRQYTLEIPFRVLSKVKITIFPVAILRNEAYDSYAALFAALSQMPPRHPAWLPYILAHEFIREPNKHTLANVIKKSVDGGWKPSPIQDTYLLLPWPLAACLAATQPVEALHTLASEIEKGQLGDIAEWQAAEVRWLSEGLKPQDLTQRPSRVGPFDSSIANSGGPPLWYGWTIANSGVPLLWYGLTITVTSEVHDYPDDELKMLFSTAEQMSSGMEREACIELLLLASRITGGIVRCIEPLRLQALLKTEFARFQWDANIIGYPEQPELVTPWLEFFDWLGHSKILSPSYHPSYHFERDFDKIWYDTWQKAFISNPAQLGLLRLLGRLAATGSVISMVPPGMIELSYFPEPRFRLAAILVRLTQPGLTEYDANDLADAAAALLDPPAEPGANGLLMRTAERNIDRVPAVERFLLRLHERMPPGVKLGLANCEGLLRQVLRRRASDPQTPGQLRKLQLPEVPSTESPGYFPI